MFAYYGYTCGQARRTLIHRGDAEVLKEMSRPREYPRPWADPNICVHPSPIILLKFRDSDETLYRCLSCGETMTADELRRRQPKQLANQP